MKKIAILWFALAATVLLISCAANDPFDPDSVANNKPTVRLFVAPVSEGGELNPTSYFERNFSWSGTDNDGFVEEFYVSIRTQSNIPAPWDTTTAQDTTMTFYTNDEGVSEATLYIACVDNRGAVSDTLVQYVPLRNFAPTVNFKSDFEPLVNMQREFNESGTDTTYWNFGVCNFRFFALDEDGASTMDPFYRYTLMDISGGDPEITFDVYDPAADPDLGWIQVPFSPDEEIKNFEILVHGTSPSTNKTLTVSVGDEAFADTRFSYSWEVRAQKSNILYVKDGPFKDVYVNFLNDLYGEDQWDYYDFWFGYADNDYTFLETMRLFDMVLWTDSGSTSAVMELASATGGSLDELVSPTDGAQPGKFMYISKAVAGTGTGLSNAFIQNVLGISPTGAPVDALGMVRDKQALGLQPHLPAITTVSTASNSGMGVVLLEGTEAIYQMEYCNRCYSNRPPPDPLVGTRWPERTTDPDATVVVISLQLERFDEAEVHAALLAIINTEFGVATP